MQSLMTLRPLVKVTAMITFKLYKLYAFIKIEFPREAHLELQSKIIDVWNDIVLNKLMAGSLQELCTVGSFIY